MVNRLGRNRKSAARRRYLVYRGFCRIEPRYPTPFTVCATTHLRLSQSAHERSVFTAAVKMGNAGCRGKRRDGLGRRKGTNGRKSFVFVVSDQEEPVELHDGKEVADDWLDVVDDDFTTFGFDAAFEANEDRDARARKVVNLGEVDCEKWFFRVATSS